MVTDKIVYKSILESQTADGELQIPFIHGLSCLFSFNETWIKIFSFYDCITEKSVLCY